MAFVVTDNCIKCKYTDCVAVCPVDAFFEGPNFLAISPTICIDCGLCANQNARPNAIFQHDALPEGQQAVYRTECRAGVDLAQYQHGQTSSSRRRFMERCYRTNCHFWKVNAQRFPTATSHSPPQITAALKYGLDVRLRYCQPCCAQQGQSK